MASKKPVIDRGLREPSEPRIFRSSRLPTQDDTGVVDAGVHLDVPLQVWSPFLARNSAVGDKQLPWGVHSMLGCVHAWEITHEVR